MTKPTNTQASEAQIAERFTEIWGIDTRSEVERKMVEQETKWVLQLIAAEKDRLIDELISGLPNERPAAEAVYKARNWVGTDEEFLESKLANELNKGFNEAIYIMEALLLEYREAK